MISSFQTRFLPCVFTIFVLLNFANANENNIDNLSNNTMLSNDKIFVVTESWFPYNYLDNNGKIIGRSTEVVKSVLNHANVPFKLSLFPWQRSYNIASTQKNVLIYSIYRTPEREKLFHWLCPLFPSPEQSIYKLASRKDLHIKKESDVNKYSLIVTRGTFLHKLFESRGMKEGVNLFLTPSNNTNLQMLLTKRVDLIIAIDEDIYQMLESLKIPADTIEKVFTLKQTDETELCMAISKGTPSYIVDKIKSSQQALYPN